MGLFRRRAVEPAKEDRRTEIVVRRLELVANRMERLTAALEAQLAAEEGGGNGAEREPVG